MLMLSLSACSEPESNQSVASDDAYDEIPPESVTKAKALIKEGKHAEAYAVLYSDRENEDVKAMLEDFQVVPTRTDCKGYLSYNYVRETEYNEYGDIISRTVSDPKFSYGEAAFSYEYIYDENDNMLKKSETDTEYGTVEVTEYEYDSLNRLVKIIEDHCTTENAYDEAGNIIKEIVVRDADTSETAYTYDENGNVLSELVYSNGEFFSLREYSYVYNEHKDIVSTSYSNSSLFNGETVTSEVTITYEYEYDELGRKTKIVSEGNAGKSTEELVYNDKGDVIKETVISSSYTTVSEYKYTYSGEKIVKERMVMNSWADSYLDEKYDKHGSLTLRQTDETCNKYEYVYDKNGFIIKKTETSEGDDYFGETKVTAIEYTNDEKGNVLKSVSVRENGIVDTKEFSYDSEGRILKETRSEDYEDYHNIYYIDEYTYDEHGNVLTHYHKYHDSEYTDTYDYVYDKNGNALEKKCNGEVDAKYAYDEKGNRIRIENYTDGSVAESTEYTYDEKGNTVKAVRYDADGAVVAVKERVYDEKGNLIKETCEKGDSEAEFAFNEYVYEYTYDELGNVLTYFESETDLNGYETTFSEYTYSAYEYFYVGE